MGRRILHHNYLTSHHQRALNLSRVYIRAHINTVMSTSGECGAVTHTPEQFSMRLGYISNFEYHRRICHL
jgi:hypothetical protein